MQLLSSSLFWQKNNHEGLPLARSEIMLFLEESFRSYPTVPQQWKGYPLSRYLKGSIPIYIRINTLKVKPKHLLDLLKKKGIMTSIVSPRIPFVATVDRGSNIGFLPEHLAGYFYIQNLASVLAVLALNPSANDIVLDGCAAPGGKTTLISQLMRNKGTVVANEIDKKRTVSLLSNISRMGCTNVIVTREDLTRIPSSTWEERFDKVLIDAPCTGDGLLPNKHEKLRPLSTRRVVEHSERQKKLVQTALKLLKPNGILVYSTCSFTIEQNEAVIRWLLENNPNVEILPADIPFDHFEGFIVSDDDLGRHISSAVARLFPFPHQTIGFFISKFRKKP